MKTSTLFVTTIAARFRFTAIGPLACMALASLAATGCQSGKSSPASPASTTAVAEVLTAERQKSLTPAQVVAELKSGNRRFVTGNVVRYNYQEQVCRTADGQYPKAVVLSCLDSRVPPEIVFDQGIGDIFVGRVAGNTENTDMLGSMEFATALAGAKAIVVLGHSNCGAIKGAADGAKLGNLTQTLDNIMPAVEAAKAKTAQGPYNSHNKSFVQAVAVENVRQTVKDITARSPVLQERVAKGELVVVGGIYDLKTGAVEWLD